MEIRNEYTETIKKLRGMRVDPLKGLPPTPKNEDSHDEGAYKDDNLADPGIVNGITGTGRGPYINDRRRPSL